MSTSSSRRHLAVFLARFATDRLERTSPRRPEPQPPLVTTLRQGNAVRLAALDAAAAAAGLIPGMSLADARARLPGLRAVEADPAAEARMLATIADWCDRFTPLVALDAPDGLVLDVSGCAALFGGEAGLARAVAEGLARAGFRARTAVADTAALAAACARFGAGGIVAPGAGAAALAPLPIAALRPAAAVLAGLARAGLLSVGDIAELPRAPLAARFGEDLVAALDRALGRAGEALAFRRTPPAYCSERGFAEPILSGEAALAAAEHLAAGLCGQMEAYGEGARRIELALFRVDGTVIRLTVGSARPLGDPAVIARLLREKAAGMPPVDPGFGFDLVRLSALVAEDRTPEQGDLAADPTLGDDLPALFDRLAARFGPETILRLLPQDAHLPERASQAVPTSAIAAAGGRAAGVAAGGGGPSSALRTPSPTSVGEGRAGGARRELPIAAAGGRAAEVVAGTGVVPASPAGGRSSRQGDEGGPTPGDGSQEAGAQAAGSQEAGSQAAGLPDTGARGARAQAAPSQDIRAPKRWTQEIRTQEIRTQETRTQETRTQETRTQEIRTQEIWAQDSLQPVRPMRLFRRPEPVEAVAEVPDGPPLRFRWRRVLHDVARAEGPERIADDWWRTDAGPTRDYFRVETAAGARLWLCRAGGYGDPGRPPRWYVHGLFA